MVNATVDNQPVSVQLSPGQSTTVPSNETWRVQLTLSVFGKIDNRSGHIGVNGVNVLGGKTNGNAQGQVAQQTVLVGGDTISLNGGQGASITGFVVNS